MALTDVRKIDRLFWRAGFGPSRSTRARFRRAGLAAAVHHLLNPPKRGVLVGPAPRAQDDAGRIVPLRPLDIWTHDVLWWLDRMVRTRAPLVERMTLNLHDHFATSNAGVGDVGLMLKQNALLRRHALGDFGALAHGIVDDQAMQRFLSLIYSSKQAPNENFARELMELFTIGEGYTERDIREAARALTGYWYDASTKRYFWSAGAHDTGVKVIFGQRGNFGPHDVVQLCLEHENHPTFICRKLWSYFSPADPPADVLTRMVRAYRKSGRSIAAVLDIILRAPAFYANLEQPDLVKPPAVFLAGAMRATQTSIDDRAWAGLLDAMGQRPFYPPNVGGWDQNDRFLSSMTLKARAQAMITLLEKHAFTDASVDPLETPEESFANAMAFTGAPQLRDGTRAELMTIAREFRRRGVNDDHTAAGRRRLLRYLLLAGPEAHVH